MKHRITLLMGVLGALALAGCGAGNEVEKARKPIDAEAPPVATTPAEVEPAPEPVTAKAPGGNAANGIVKLEGKQGEPFDLGEGLRFTLTKSYEEKVTVNGESVSRDQILEDEHSNLYYANGVCWRTRTSFMHCDGELQLFYRRVEPGVSDLDRCREALRYELTYPRVGAKLDAEQLFECQSGRGPCPRQMPAEQLACKSSRDCTISHPDGLCCRLGRFVAYNKDFAAKLNAHRKEACAEVSCYESAHAPGYAKSHCVDGRCTLDPDRYEDEQHPFCL